MMVSHFHVYKLGWFIESKLFKNLCVKIKKKNNKKKKKKKNLSHPFASHHRKENLE
jgi:hypothetical protein